MGWICLIRLRDLRLQGLPHHLGVGSENAAHRIAVKWTAEGDQRSGVYVSRRDYEFPDEHPARRSTLSAVHHHASFTVDESEPRYELSMRSDDGETRVRVAGEPTDSLPEASVFDSVETASAFFEDGSLGYSPNDRTGEFDALELHTDDWEVTPLSVTDVSSSYFEDLPDDAAAFDHALLMRDIDHEWREGKAVCPAATAD